jgi:hypothetical protein
MSGMVITDYDIERHKNINYLVDYSSYLFKSNNIDGKILKWQAENAAILKPLGLDYVTLKKVIKIIYFRNYKNRISLTIGMIVL